MQFSDLRNTHKNQAAYIIGKGPSLEYLRREHIGAGAVIALNQTIIRIQSFNLSNPFIVCKRMGAGRGRQLSVVSFARVEIWFILISA